MPLFAHHHEITSFSRNTENVHPSLTNQSSQQATLYDVDLLNLEYDRKGPGIQSQPMSVRKNETSSVCHPPTPQLRSEKQKEKTRRSWAGTEPSASTPQGCPVYPHPTFIFDAVCLNGKRQQDADQYIISYCISGLIFFYSYTWPWPRPSLNLPHSQCRTNISEPRPKVLLCFSHGGVCSRPKVGAVIPCATVYRAMC